MQTAYQPEYLSFGDALFLYLEHEGTPLNIASVAVFEGEISLDDLSRFVESKLPHIPRYVQRVVIPPFSVGLPYWEVAPDFDLKNHLHEVSLKHGTESELKAAASGILSPTMNRRNPLWDLTLIHGMKGGQTGLVARIHHCLADGLSGVGILNTLMDASPKVPRIPKSRRFKPLAAPRDPAAMLLDSAVETWLSGIQRVLSVASEVLTLAQRAAGGASKSDSAPDTGVQKWMLTTTDMAKLFSQLSSLPDRLPFNVLCTGPQSFEWTETPLPKLKAIKNACGTTVNDVMLTVLTAGFRRYAESHGVQTRGRTLRIVVPVSTRREHNNGELGNHITFAPVDTPLGIRNPKELLLAVHERMQFVKTGRMAEFVALAGTLLGTIPAPLQAALAPMISKLPLSLCNTICTNVPGPQFPIYLMGHKMTRAYPYVPIGGEMGLNCAVLTYNDVAFFGFTGDVSAAKHLKRLPAFVDEAIGELAAAMGIPEKSAARKTRRKPTKATAAQARAEPVAVEAAAEVEPGKMNAMTAAVNAA